MSTMETAENRIPLNETHTAFKKSIDGQIVLGSISTAIPTVKTKDPNHGKDDDYGLNLKVITNMGGRKTVSTFQAGCPKRSFGERCLWL